MKESRTEHTLCLSSVMTLLCLFVLHSVQLVEKLTTIAEECQSAQLKKLRDICEK